MKNIVYTLYCLSSPGAKEVGGLVEMPMWQTQHHSAHQHDTSPPVSFAAAVLPLEISAIATAAVCSIRHVGVSARSPASHVCVRTSGMARGADINRNGHRSSLIRTHRLT